MSGVSPPGECVPPPPPPAFGAGVGHIRWLERGVGGSIFWKTPDSALYSTYVSTLWGKGIQRVLAGCFTSIKGFSD
jgi:hypothetical protein